MNKIIRFFGMFLFSMLAIGVWSIAEEITLTTYYPAPYGAYDELTTTGNTYLATTSGKVGIGTTTPSSKLQVDLASDNDNGFRVSSGTKGNIVIRPHVNAATAGYQVISFNGDPIDFFSRYNVGKNMWVIGANQVGSEDSFFIDTWDGSAMTRAITILTNGNVGIGTISPGGYKLDVAGVINATDVHKSGGFTYNNPDYVFEPAYLLMPLTELRNFVMEHKHLPRMPSKEDIANSGVAIFEQNRLILEKLEEAYLYIFELEKRIEKLERR